MDVFQAIESRASVRSFSGGHVAIEQLQKLVDAGRRAPTGRNVQPWEFVVLTKKDMLQKLAALTDHGPFIAQAAACIAVYCRDTKYYLEDGCAAVENILLAAVGLGLGACWVAGDKKAYVADVAALLNAPKEMKLVALISVGYPVRQVEPKSKRSLEQVLHWETF